MLVGAWLVGSSLVRVVGSSVAAVGLSVMSTRVGCGVIVGSELVGSPVTKFVGSVVWHVT